MNDLDPRDLVSAFIDGELSGEELLGFEAAMTSDSGLAEEVASLRSLVSELGDLPEMEVPAAVTEAVLARVEGLPIPGTAASPVATTEVATAQVAAEEGVGLITETGVAADIPKLALSALIGGGGLSGMLEALSSSLWLKVPAGAAVAGLLALGMSHLIAPQTSGPPAAEFASTDGARGDAPVAAGAFSGDGVVSLDLEADIVPHRETSPAPEDDFGAAGSEPLMSRPAARVRSGSAAAPGAPSHTPEKSSVTVPESAVGPDGVYEAEWEAEDEAGVVVMDEEAPSPTGGAFKGAGGSAASASDGRVADVTMDGEPLEDHLEPEADKEILAEQGRVVREVALVERKKNSVGARSPAPLARSERAVVSDTVDPSPAPEPAQESTPRAGNTLKVRSRAAANRLVQDLTAASGVDVQVSRHRNFFSLVLEVPVGDWDATLVTLRSAGGLDLSAGALITGEQQRLALDVLW